MSDRDEERGDKIDKPAMNPVAWKFPNMLTMTKLRLPKAYPTPNSWDPKPTVTTNGDRNGDQRVRPAEHDQDPCLGGRDDESPITITRVRVCVRESPSDVARAGNAIVQELDQRVARERYWRARIGEWAAEVPLSDEVRDDALAQLEALGWPETAEINYELS